MASIIGTWRMSYDSVAEAYRRLCGGESAMNAVEYAVAEVEKNPAFTSVGYGGLPARDGQVYLDAGWMDGNTLRCGAVLSVRHISSPVKAARLLCGRAKNWMLCGEGAEAFAIAAGIPVMDMRTDNSVHRWRERLADEISAAGAYDGHDTVCVIAKDDEGHLIVGTSTSGLFMKEPGRVGDTPIAGSGFYADAEAGAAAATGLGEDIMRGCLSYETVARMRAGDNVQHAVETALQTYMMRRDRMGEETENISLIAMDAAGNVGAATSMESFPFAAGTPDGMFLYEAVYRNGQLTIGRRHPEDIPLGS